MIGILKIFWKYFRLWQLFWKLFVWGFFPGFEKQIKNSFRILPAGIRSMILLEFLLSLRYFVKIFLKNSSSKNFAKNFSENFSIFFFRDSSLDSFKSFWKDFVQNFSIINPEKPSDISPKVLPRCILRIPSKIST